MSSPTFLEKLDAYIECLNQAAELAFQHPTEAEIHEDDTPICNKCRKRRKLNFDNSYQDDAFISDNSFDNSIPKKRLSSANYDVIRRSSLKDNNKKRSDGTFVSAMLKTLVTLNSSSESLNLTTNRSVSETISEKKKAFLRRRHTTTLNADLSAYAAVNGGKTNTSLQTANKAICNSAKNDNTAILRSKVVRKPRPLSYPNRQHLLRQATASNLGKDKMSLISSSSATDKKEKVLLSNDNISGDGIQNSHFSVKKIMRSKPITIQTSTSAKNEGKSHQIYYSLSPDLLDSPLKLEDLTKMRGCEKDKTSGSKNGDFEEENGTSHDSSLSSNPEYFSVISKRKKKLQKKSQKGQNLEYGRHSLPANISSHTSEVKNRNFASTGNGSPEDTALGALHGKQCSHSLDDLSDGKFRYRQFNDLEDTGNTSDHHGDGLLYTSSFGIGDHASCSNLAESDLVADGYCKCSFCNHDMIFTPMKSETRHIPPKNDIYEKDFATIHDELLKLRSFSMSDDSMTSFRASQYEPRTDLQTDHFPYPRLPKEFMTSQNDDNIGSQLDISMDVECSCDEDNTTDDNKSMRVSPVQKALQRDIEKHSSGVASVLNLCEVLLHDGDACSNDSEKDSIEQATNSLDRRWRNICSLSMERKLKIEETQRLWKKFIEDYSRFSDWLRSAEHVVARPNTYMVAYTVAREELRKFESFQRQVHESLTQLELINKQYRRLARENRTDATNKLKHMIHDGNSRWDVISHRVTGILRRLKHAISRREEFETHRESLLVWLTETDLRLTNVEHFMQSENYDKLKEVKNFQATIEERIPRIILLNARGQHLIEKSEESDCVTVEEELSELHRYCKEVISRLDKYHKRLLRIMNEPPPLDSSLFEDSELAQLDWFGNYIITSSSRNSSPVSPGLHSPDHDRLLATSKSQTRVPRSRHSTGSHSGRATPESLEWDLYDISQSELETKDNGALTDDGSIPEISPLETASDDIPLLHVSRDSNRSTPRDHLNASRRSHDTTTSHDVTDDLSPAKKLRTSQDEQRMQFMNDLVATLAWLDATNKVTDQEKKKSESKFDKTIQEIEQEVKEQRDLQKSLEQRKAIVLSINLVSKSFADSDVTMRLSRMNRNWDSLQQKSINWNKTLQESLLHSQEFHSTLSQLASWVDLQNQRRDDMSMIQQRQSADSSPSSKMQKLRRDHKVLDQMRIDSLEAIKKVSSMQEIYNQLTMPMAGERVHLVEGIRALSEKVASTNGRLKSLLDAVRSDLTDIEHKIKATRRRAREERSSESDTESSEERLRSSTPIRLRMLQRKVEASELHSSGRNPNDDETMTTIDNDDDVTKKPHSDITGSSFSSIDDVTHRSLHAGSKKLRKTNTSPKTVLGQILATKKTIVSAEKRGVTVALSARKITKSKTFAVPLRKQIDNNNNKKSKCAGLCCRVCFAALPFYILMFLLFLIPWFLQAVTDDGNACLRQNNYAFSFTPMLTYTNGPPPI